MAEGTPKRVDAVVRPARASDAPALADIQERTIQWGELRNLGRPFMTLLHRHLITSPHGLCYVAELDGEIVGYSAWTYDTSRLYRGFLLKYGIPATLVVLPRLLNPRTFRPLLRGLTYTGVAHPEDPKAEMLFFALLPTGRHGGLGTAIFAPMLEEMRRRGVRSLKAATITPNNQPALRFYDRHGFRYVRTDRFYSDTEVLVYVLDLK